jgi:hypothetical protein
MVKEDSHQRRLTLRTRFRPVPSFPALVVLLICRNPIDRKSFLCGTNVKLPITDHITPFYEKEEFTELIVHTGRTFSPLNGSSMSR